MNLGKLIKIIVAIIIIVILIVVGVNFFKGSKPAAPKITPNPAPVATDFDKDCQVAAKKLHDAYLITYAGEVYQFQSHQTYNTVEGTCFYAQSYTGTKKGTGDFSNALIIDTATEKTVIEYNAESGKQVGKVTKDDFNAKYQELFATAQGLLPAN